MIYLKNTIKCDCFTDGKFYPVFDFLEDGGLVVYDDDNKVHYISGEFSKKNFSVCESIGLLKCVSADNGYSNFFTVGNYYPILCWLEGGAVVIDDEYHERWLSGLYGLANFKQIS